MFWRLLRRSIAQARGRWAVALLALVAIAALCSSLGNVYLDVSRKLTREFRAYGANIVIAAPGGAGAQTLLQESTVAAIPEDGNRILARAPFLYVVARVDTSSVIVVGTWLDRMSGISPWWKISGTRIESGEDLGRCLIGEAVARRWNLVPQQAGRAPGQTIELRHRGRVARLTVAGVITAGGSEDSQIFVNLPVAQQLADLPGKIGLVQVSASGTPQQLEDLVADMRRRLPYAEVKPVRQVAVAEGQLLRRIQWMLAVTTLAILVVVTLCVAATMTGMAFERRYDIGVMKALGAGEGTVVRLFMVEAMGMALVGGLAGYGLGLVLAAWIGQQVFHTSLQARWVVFPLALGVSLLVAMIGTIFPVRLLERMHPAVILRGE